jgi:hypothetical protein
MGVNGEGLELKPKGCELLLQAALLSPGKLRHPVLRRPQGKGNLSLAGEAGPHPKGAKRIERGCSMDNPEYPCRLPWVLLLLQLQGYGGPISQGQNPSQAEILSMLGRGDPLRLGTL